MRLKIIAWEHHTFGHFNTNKRLHRWRRSVRSQPLPPCHSFNYYCLTFTQKFVYIFSRGLFLSSSDAVNNPKYEITILIVLFFLSPLHHDLFFLYSIILFSFYSYLFKCFFEWFIQLKMERILLDNWNRTWLFLGAVLENRATESLDEYLKRNLLSVSSSIFSIAGPWHIVTGRSFFSWDTYHWWFVSRIYCELTRACAACCIVNDIQICMKVRFCRTRYALQALSGFMKSFPKSAIILIGMKTTMTAV